MPKNERIISDYQATSGNLDGLAAGTITPGAVLSTQTIRDGTLSARFTVEAETDTIQIEALWQVSRNGKTGWRECQLAWVLAIGTAGDDAPVEKVVDAPSAPNGYAYVRAAVRNKVAVGAATDTWAIDYSYERSDIV